MEVLILVLDPSLGVLLTTYLGLPPGAFIKSSSMWDVVED